MSEMYPGNRFINLLPHFLYLLKTKLFRIVYKNKYEHNKYKLVDHFSVHSYTIKIHFHNEVEMNVFCCSNGHSIEASFIYSIELLLKCLY